MAQNNRYSKLASNTMLFAISNFSSKLLNLFVKPFLTYALQDAALVGVTSLTSQCANLLIPVVSLGISFAIIRFGLDKECSKSQVFTNGLVTIGCGFGVLVLLLPVLGRVPIMREYLFLLYIYVLVSCLRTLCTQFVRSRMLNRLVALDGILTTATLFAFYYLFLIVFPLGPNGYLLAIICSDACSALFVFFAGRLMPYLQRKSFNLTLWKEMLRYSVPMIPAQISFWIINAADLYFVTWLMGDGGTAWAGLLSIGYYMPTIVTTLGGIFYEAWQLSAVTEETEREEFFSRIFNSYQSVMFCCGAGIIWLSRVLMHAFQANFYEAWRFVPFLTLAAVFTCFNQFFNSIYMVYKRSRSSLNTMLAGAVANCFLNYLLIRGFGPIGATVASFLSLLLVFCLRAADTRGLLFVDYSTPRLVANIVMLVAESLLLLADNGFCNILVFLLTVAVIVFNFKEVWGLAGIFLGRFFPKLFPKT